MTKTTPTPWLLDNIFGNIVMNDEDNKVIAYTQTRAKYFPVEVCKANAEFIVRAVNCHAELVAALEGVVRIADRKTVEFDAARSALAKAEGSIDRW